MSFESAPRTRTQSKRRYDPNVGEAPFYVGREVVRLSAEAFARAKTQLATYSKPLATRTSAAAEAVLVHGMSYAAAAAALGESQSYVRSAHVWTLERMQPYLGDVAVSVVVPPLVLQGVPAELHAGIRERVEKMVAQYMAAQGETAAPTETGTPATET